MPAIKKYNGWTNYETWCVNLWLTDEASTEQEVRMLAQMHDVSVGYRADRIHDLVSDVAGNEQGSKSYSNPRIRQTLKSNPLTQRLKDSASGAVRLDRI